MGNFPSSGNGKLSRSYSTGLGSSAHRLLEVFDPDVVVIVRGGQGSSVGDDGQALRSKTPVARDFLEVWVGHGQVIQGLPERVAPRDGAAELQQILGSLHQLFTGVHGYDV